MSELLDVAKKTVELAKARGAKDARAAAYRTREVSLTWRDGKVENVSEATSRGVSVALYVDGRYASVSSSDLRPEAIDKLLTDSIAMARTLAVDPFRTLPDPKLYEGRSTADLALVDPKLSQQTPDARRALAKALEDAARSVKGSDAILSVTSSVSDSESRLARVTSNGFEGERSTTDFSIGVDVSVKDPDGRRPEDGLYAASRFLTELPGAAELGRASAERAMACIGSKKAESKVMTMVVENRVARRLVSALLGALSARQVQQKQSFLDGKIGTAIGSKLFTMIDDPLVQRGLGSRHFDNEGIAAKRFPVVENGVLKAFYVDDYYGKKLKIAPTTAGASNLLFPGGKGDLESLVKGVKDGVLVTGFLGGNTNSTTGDYSLGIQGFRLRDGKRAEAIGETNISGNQLALWSKLVGVGLDAYAYSSMRTPTLVFDGVQFAGT